MTEFFFLQNSPLGIQRPTVLSNVKEKMYEILIELNIKKTDFNLEETLFSIILVYID